MTAPYGLFPAEHEPLSARIARLLGLAPEGAPSYPLAPRDALDAHPQARGENPLSAADEMLQMANPADTYANKAGADSVAKAEFTPAPKTRRAGSPADLSKLLRLVNAAKSAKAQAAEEAVLSDVP